jgi:hypothetical protein
MAAGRATARQRSFTARIHSTAPPRGAFLCMVRFDEPFEPMTLGSMRANRVRALALSCLTCPHETVINADKRPDQDWRKDLQEPCPQIHGRRSSQNAKRPPSTSNAVRRSSNPSPRSPKSPSQPDMEVVSGCPALTNLHKTLQRGNARLHAVRSVAPTPTGLVGPLARWPRGGALRCRTCARPLDGM